MTDNKPAAGVDVTKDWKATQGQEAAATRLRIFAAISWIVAIGGEIAGIVLLYKHKFDHGNLPLLIGLLVGIAIFAIAGNMMWKAANRHDPARESDKSRYFFQNQLGAIITVIAFLPLVFLILNDKDLDPQSKKIAGGVGAALAVIATLVGVDFKPPSVEQYTQDMNACATRSRRGSPLPPVRPRSPPRRKILQGTPPQWLRRRRARPTQPVRMSCTGSRRKTGPKRPKRRMFSTYANA